MSYIDLINNFWRLNKEHSFTPNEKAVYFALLNKANELMWKNPFNQSNGYLALDSGMSEPAMIRARNTLKQKGLISYSSEVGRRHNTSYEIKYLKSFSISGSISDSISDSISGSISGSISDENRLHNIRHKTRIDQTREARETRDIPPSPLCASGEEFFSVETLLEQQLADQRWIESIYLQLRPKFAQAGLRIDAVERYLREFAGEVRIKGDEAKSRRDFMAHFVNWLKINLDKNGGAQQQQTQTAVIARGSKL